MAASYENVDEWRALLNSLKIFHKLRKTHLVSEESEPKNLLAIQDGRIFVWDGESRLLTANLYEVSSMDTNASESQSDITPFQGDVQEQSLLCTDTPFFKVEQVSFNSTRQQLLLWGKRGVSVLHLPRNQGKKGAFQGGQECINCRTVPIAERFFNTNPSISLLQASWHPGSESASHVVLLTSDNTVRIFATSNTNKALQVTKLVDGGPSYSLSLTHSTFQVALGDIAVAFDFGVPYDSADGKDVLYPLYILKGNGDVFTLVTSLASRRYQLATPQGPLVMHPPAEDNYGLDACSITCLHSNPPVLVIATSTSFLHHCILLSNNDDEEALGSSSFQASSTALDVFSDRSSRERTFHMDQSNQSLFVYESVELSLTPVLSENDDLDVAYPIMLIKDSQSEHCYYCCHGAGLHSVSLPWLDHMERFCNIDEEVDDEVSEVQRDHPCVVQHLICTKPSQSCPPAPVLGLAPLVDPLLGNIMVCLSSEGECFVLPLMSEPVGVAGSLLSEKPSVVVSPLRKLKPFEHHIRTLLQRDISNPILKTSTKTELSLEESFKLLQRATRILREEYIMKQDQAREEIEKRSKILAQQKSQQFADLRECSKMESEIKEHASGLAERYEETQDKQEELLHRVGVVLHSLQNQLPTLSEAEQAMKAELTEMDSKLKYMETALTQVKTKFNYHKNSVETRDPRKSPGLSTTQQKRLKELLKEENEKISELIAEVKSLTTVVAS